MLRADLVLPFRAPGAHHQPVTDLHALCRAWGGSWVVSSRAGLLQHMQPVSSVAKWARSSASRLVHQLPADIHVIAHERDTIIVRPKLERISMFVPWPCWVVLRARVPEDAGLPGRQLDFHDARIREVHAAYGP